MISSLACFIGDVRVYVMKDRHVYKNAWCNSLGDCHFQTYVMNFVEIVIDYYLLIMSHVSHAFTSCTYYTQINVKPYTCVLTNLAIFDYS